MSEYERITVIGPKEKNNHKVLCRCDCGTEKMINIYNLKSGCVKSCGCFKKERMVIEAKKRFSGSSPANVKDYSGLKIGCVSVLKKIVKDKCQTNYEVKCDCGEIFISPVRRTKFKKCRCGYKNHKLKFLLAKMIDRCENIKSKSYFWYGNKKIKVCEEWKHFPIKFIKWALENGYKEHLTIDRIDSSKNYCPENCQWITREENSKKAAVERWNLTRKT
jgi:hypothetical protein